MSDWKYFVSKTTFFFVFLFFSVLPVVSHAQENAVLTLIPAMIEKAADPGTVLNETLKITNESPEEK